MIIEKSEVLKIAEDSFNQGYEGAKEDMSNIFDAFILWHWGQTGVNLQDSFREFAANYKHPKL